MCLLCYIIRYRNYLYTNVTRRLYKLLIYLRGPRYSVPEYEYSNIPYDSRNECHIHQMNYELLETRSKYLKKLSENGNSQMDMQSRVRTSYPNVPQPSFENSLYFDPDVYFACIHWLGKNGCACCHLEFPWRSIINVAHFLASDYLFILALRQITVKNSLDMLEQFEIFLRPSSWAWQAIQIRIHMFLCRLSPKMVPQYVKAFRVRFGVRLTDRIPILNQAMRNIVIHQFQQENHYGSSRYFVAAMVHYLEPNDPLIELLEKCILYYYTIEPYRFIYNIQKDVAIVQFLRSGVELAIERFAQNLRQNYVKCCACNKSFIPSRPILAAKRAEPPKNAAVFTPCCLEYMHQSCFQNSLGHNARCPRCMVVLPLFTRSTNPDSYLQIYLLSIRYRVTAQSTNLPLPSFL